jgi:uncharacterized protein YegL
MSQVPYDGAVSFPVNDSSFIENPESRCPCVLVLDTSGSMSGEPIEELNRGLQEFQREISADSMASKRVECAVIAFGSEARLISDFVTVDSFVAPSLSAGGATAMGAAVNLAMDKITERKRIYRHNGVSYFRPWVLLISDGEPTDQGVWELAAQRARDEQAGKSLVLHAIGVQHSNLEVLGRFSATPAVRLQGLKFSEFFRWLSSSLASRSRSSPNGEIVLPSPFGAGGWATLPG